jgi:hypothetical protein
MARRRGRCSPATPGDSREHLERPQTGADQPVADVRLPVGRPACVLGSPRSAISGSSAARVGPAFDRRPAAIAVS